MINKFSAFIKYNLHLHELKKKKKKAVKRKQSCIPRAAGYLQNVYLFFKE
jgi:hypothetical protein